MTLLPLFFMRMSFRKSDESGVVQTVSQYPIYDATFKHPFTMTVAGPSQSGKSTFTYNLLKNEKRHINIDAFDKITLCVGTQVKGNILGELSNLYPGKVDVIEVRSKYDSPEDLIHKFPTDFKRWAQDPEEMKTNRCIVFDDLMTELSSSDLLLNIFTKYSSHCNLSCINLTQNLFHRTKGGGSDNTSVYRNTRYVVFFDNAMDSLTARLLAQRLATGKSFASTLRMIREVTQKYKYIVIDGDMRPKVLSGNDQTDGERIKYSSDIFCDHPFIYKRIFEPTTSTQG